MTRKERQENANKKRKEIALWITETLKSLYIKLNDWEASVDKMESKIADKIATEPQNKELILEGVKLWKDSFTSIAKETQNENPHTI